MAIEDDLALTLMYIETLDAGVIVKISLIIPVRNRKVVSLKRLVLKVDRLKSAHLVVPHPSGITAQYSYILTQADAAANGKRRCAALPLTIRKRTDGRFCFWSRIVVCCNYSKN